MGKYINSLKETDLFYNLTQMQLEMVESLCEEVIYQPGEVVIAENSHEKELYIILRGEAEVLVNPGMVSPMQAVSAKMQKLASLSRGQSFGEIALVDEGVRTATVRAAGKDTLMLKISRDRLLLLCNTYPELGYKIMYNLAVDLANKIRNTDLKIREAMLYQRHNPD